MLKKLPSEKGWEHTLSLYHLFHVLGSYSRPIHYLYNGRYRRNLLGVRKTPLGLATREWFSVSLYSYRTFTNLRLAV